MATLFQPFTEAKPQEINLNKTLPRHPSGKLLKRLLRDPD
jgi:acyl-coenzyme A synthetase/AMP-(fatty) acid ligase